MKKRIRFTTALCVMAIGLSACAKQDSPPAVAEPEATTITTEAATEDTEEDTTEKASVESTEDTTKEPETETTTEADPTQDSPAATTMSDDPYSFQIQVGEDILHFPMKYTELTAKGWVYDGDDTEILDAHYVRAINVFDKGKLSAYFAVLNADINALPYNQCLIGGIELEQRSIEKADITASLPAGISLGVSTVEDIKKAYGTPSYENTTDSGSTYLDYTMGSDQKISLTIDGDTSTLRQIKIENYIVPEGFETSDVNSEVPEVLGKYNTPAAMSEDFSDFVVRYGDSLYRLPAPVSTFEANGWKVLEDKSNLQVAGRDFGWVTLVKDNQTLKVIANNYSEQATSIRNCFVKTVLSDERTKIPLSIAKGITIGMSKADLEQALSDISFETEEGSSYICYKVVPGKSSLDAYEIYVHTSDSLVYKIEVENSPKFNAIDSWLSK